MHTEPKSKRPAFWRGVSRFSLIACAVVMLILVSLKIANVIHWTWTDIALISSIPLIFGISLLSSMWGAIARSTFDRGS